MKKITSTFTLLMLLVAMVGCLREPMAMDSASTSSMRGAVSSTENLAQTIPCYAIEASVIYSPELKINNLAIDGTSITFDYLVGELEGNANLRPSFARYMEMWDEGESISYMALVFENFNGSTKLNVEWTAAGISKCDVFLLDVNTNLWYYRWENTALHPVALSEIEASRIFTDTYIEEFSLFTFVCDETIYDVSFYTVSDIDGVYGPDTLLANYDVYDETTLFLWQTDGMYKWHLSMEYTDAAGKTHYQRFSLQNYRYLDPTVLIPLEEPDWNTGIG